MADPRDQTQIHSMEQMQIHSTGQTQTPSRNSLPKPVIPRRNVKLFSAGFSFFVAGTNDGSMGALLPYMLKYYDIDTSFIALMYVKSRPSIR